MGVFGAFFGCIGDGGFNGCCSGASSGDGGFILACLSGCSGVGGFNVAMVSRLARETVRPARSKHPKIGLFALVGRVFRGNAAGEAVLGELFRANWPCAGLGYSAAHFRLAAMGVLQH